MTDRLREDQFDRQIRDFLGWQAEDIADAPSATEMAMRISSRAATRTVGLRLTPQLVWVLLAALLVVALVGAAAIGANLLRNDPVRSSSYEAVFLRLEVVAGSPIVHVVGVSPEGRERQIARLVDPGLNLGSRFVPPFGAVSLSGLLVVPRSSGGSRAHWEIVDLRRPQAEPVVINGIERDVELLNRTGNWAPGHRVGPFWGPRERLAISWSQRLSFVDGRTGAVTTLDTPDLYIVPAWASDGSGVFVGSINSDVGLVRAVLRPDGSVVEGAIGQADGGYGRRYLADGSDVSPLGEGVLGHHPDGSLDSMLSLTGVEVGDIAWTAAGDGVWLVLRSGSEGHRLTVERRVSGQQTTVATLGDATPEAGSVLAGHLVGFAPDDSMMIVGMDRLADITSDGFSAAELAPVLIVGDTYALVETQGSFAGWLEVQR